MGSKQVRQLQLQACLLLVSASYLVHMHLQLFRLQLVRRMLLFLMTMSKLKEAALMLQLGQCQIDVLMRCSRLSP
jgi:hypothetical protein